MPSVISRAAAATRSRPQGGMTQCQALRAERGEVSATPGRRDGSSELAWLMRSPMAWHVARRGGGPRVPPRLLRCDGRRGRRANRPAVRGDFGSPGPADFRKRRPGPPSARVCRADSIYERVDDLALRADLERRDRVGLGQRRDSGVAVHSRLAYLAAPRAPGASRGPPRRDVPGRAAGDLHTAASIRAAVSVSCPWPRHRRGAGDRGPRRGVLPARHLPVLELVCGPSFSFFGQAFAFIRQRPDPPDGSDQQLHVDRTRFSSSTPCGPTKRT